MPSLRSRYRVAAALTASALVFSQTPAYAQNLFDMLFGGGVRRERAPEPAPQPAPAPRAVAKKQPMIAAPSYYTYKPDALVKVNFAAIVERPVRVAFEPSLDLGGFDEAVGALQDWELRAEKDIAAALAAYYAGKRAYIWVTGYGVNAKAADALRVLGEAASFGLNPSDYAVPSPGTGFDLADIPARNAELIRFEMALSARALRYVRDAWAGRIDPNRLSGYHDFPKKALDLAGVLDRLAHAGDARAFLESRHPQNDRYEALRAELAKLQASEENDIVVDPELLLKPGESSPELRKLLTLFYRQADEATMAGFGPVLAAYQARDVYAPALVPAVKAMQAQKGLKPDGVIGPRTVAAFAGLSRASRIAKVEIALEQLRWHPSDLGSPRVFINQPAFTATYNEGGEDRLTMRVVIGKVSNQTSFFFDEIERVEYNPYWGVPQSIIVNEMLPRLRNDPGYLDRAGYEVHDSKGQRVPSTSVNWWAYGAKVPYSIRQTPSEANALGELKILFPNTHAIYMHDTPQKSFFERDVRAFSHGCVRLSDPRAMAAAVLGTGVDHVAARIEAGHSSEKVKRKIPVYVAYFTAWPDQHGAVGYFADVYDRDERVAKALDATAAVRAPAG